MTQPDPETGDEVARIKAIQDNADRLGLTWGLRPATVTSNLDPVMARYDGDSEAIAMVSMIGVLAVGQRVYAIRIPPSGNYIVGEVTNPLVARLNAVLGSVPTGTVVTITWGTPDEQTGAVFCAVPSTIIQIPETGIWEITYNTVLATSSGTRNFIAINVTTGIANQPAIYRSNWGPGEGLDHVSFSAPFLAGDTFTANIFQNSGGPLNLTFGSLFLRKSANWIQV